MILKDPPMSPVLDRFLDAHPGHDLDRDGLRLHYVDEGDGEPVVMVHGNPTWSFFFRPLIDGLRETNRVIVPDHIGCGLSEKPDDDHYSYTLESRVDDLELLLDRLGIDRNITLVLHDWGGMIGTAYATRHPERIARMVVMNTGGFHLPDSKPFPWPLRLGRDTAIGGWLIRRLNAFCVGTAIIGCTKRRMPREVRRAMIAPYDSWRNRIAVHRFVQDIPLFDGDRAYDLVTLVASRLESLASVPMLIAWGMKDFVFDRHFLDTWIKHFPKADVHRFPQAGHYLLEDEPEAVLALVREFLSVEPVGRECAAR
jgi:haloalkane dehalogenase